MTAALLADICEIELPLHTRGDGSLIPLEQGKTLPFPVRRIFFVLAIDGAVRGQHAHKQCQQLFLCPRGEIEVECNDGKNTRRFLLVRPNQALLIPPGIWAAETYRGNDSVLTVLCDRPYEEDDYLRSYEAFRGWRKNNT
jgi:dTDP-4-dehydrorhamnose 3,5-epimerase-like enzyme